MSVNITPGRRTTYVRYSESVEVEQPNGMLAEQHRKMAEPGSGEK